MAWCHVPGTDYPFCAGGGGMDLGLMLAEPGYHTGAFVEWLLAAHPNLAPALGFDDCVAWARRLAADPEGSLKAAAEPALHRMADGLAHRARALRLLGNGVHLLVAAHAWRALAAAHGRGQWIWRPTEAPYRPAQMTLFDGLQP